MYLEAYKSLMMDSWLLISQEKSPFFPAKGRKTREMCEWDKTETVRDVEKRQTDGETEGKGVSVERIYEWGLSVGDGPGPSVVHSSVIFTTPQAPMCLPVAAMYTHTHTLARTPSTVHTLMYACTYRQQHSHCTITPLLCLRTVNICSHFCLSRVHLILRAGTYHKTTGRSF